MGKSAASSKISKAVAAAGVLQAKLVSCEESLLQTLVTNGLWAEATMDLAIEMTLKGLRQVDECLDAMERAKGGFVEDSFWNEGGGEEAAEAEEATKLKGLQAFLREHSEEGVCDAWELRKLDEASGKGRGVYACKDLELHETVFKVPSAVMLSVFHGRALDLRGADGESGPTGAVWDAHINSVLTSVQDNDVVSLALVLLHHAVSKEASYFWPFINSLPREYDIPTFWPSSIFSMIRDDKTACKAKLNVRATAMLFMRCRRSMQGVTESMREAGVTACNDSSPWLAAGGKALSWKYFRWAMATVTTRQNYIPVRDLTLPVERQARALTLVPGWDMMNHASGEMTTDFDIETASIVFKTMAGVASGEEISMCYGTRCNDQLLIYSGFVAEGNKDDTISFDVSFTADSTLPCKMRKGVYKMLTSVQLPDAAESAETSLSIPVALAPPTSSEGVRCVKVLGEATLSALIAGSVQKSEVAMVLRAEQKDAGSIYEALGADTKTAIWKSLAATLTDSDIMHTSALQVGAKTQPSRESKALTASTLPTELQRRWSAAAHSIEILNKGHAAIKSFFLEHCSSEHA